MPLESDDEIRELLSSVRTIELATARTAARRVASSRISTGTDPYATVSISYAAEGPIARMRASRMMSQQMSAFHPAVIGTATNGNHAFTNARPSMRRTSAFTAKFVTLIFSL